MVVGPEFIPESRLGIAGNARSYTFFDLLIESRLPLPLLAPAGDSPADWSVTGGNVGDSYRHFHSWRSADGAEVMRASRSGDNYVLEFPGLARYEINFGSRAIVAEAAAGCGEHTLAHLLLDQVLPRAVCHQGRMVLHASAVALPDDSAIAFTGVSGRGKSTLAAAFFRAGYRLLSDDCLLLEAGPGGVHALPAYPSLRLWPAAADVLFSEMDRARLDSTPMAHYTDKQVLQPGPGAPEPVAPLSLRALYLLEAPAGADAPIRIEPVTGMRAIMALVEAQFTLDVVDRKAVQRNFEALREFSGRAPLYRLSYPRKYGLLPKIVSAVLVRNRETRLF